MKRMLLLIFIGWLVQAIACATLWAQHCIEGRVVDESGRPLSDVNLFIKETLEGCSSDTLGGFCIRTGLEGPVTLCALLLGYRPGEYLADTASDKPLTIRMRAANIVLDNVEVVASQFRLKGSSEWSRMGAVDLVTAGAANGDLYRSIATLPGTQMAGENGRLFIRGGDSREVQTYIDDMHVMNPYTTTAGETTPVRGRYSPFMFEGMNFSLGGYDPEYAQGLSSVLPLTTKDDSPVSKYGINLSSVGVGGGGRKAFTNGSAALDLDYQHLGPYYALVPDRTDWVRPYQKFSAGTQGRYRKDAHTVAKVYAGYDYTSLANREEGRVRDMREHNYYLNGTFRRRTAKGARLFAGAAFSFLRRQVRGALQPADRFRNGEWELHLKVKADRRLGTRFSLQAGAETMVRSLSEQYIAGMVPDAPGHPRGADRADSAALPAIRHAINACFATARFRFSEPFSAELSSRLEYTTGNRSWNYSPRLALVYTPGPVSLSGIVGRYTQLASNDYLLRNLRLPSESCWHYILGAYYQSAGRIYRAELYDKQYDRLICDRQGTLEASGGGYSRGVDLYFEDAALWPNLEYRLSYSCNDSKRKYREVPVRDVPQYATRHNASLSVRYHWSLVRSILSLTDRFASGRPYHDPNRTGYMNRVAPFYNSLDLGITFLASPKVIIYASASNLLGRKEIYNYRWTELPEQPGRYAAHPVLANADRFFFIGVFITLGGHAAYDVSNF